MPPHCLPTSLAGCLALAMLSACGCTSSSLSDQLEGRWVGRPDTAAARQERTPSVLSTVSPSAASAEGRDDAEPTDLEAFDFRITMQFAPRGELTMWLGGGEQKINGSWRIESQTGIQALLEITDQPPVEAGAETPSSGGSPANANPTTEQRRFELQMDPSGDGFTLREEGADPAFGWLYFVRDAAASP